MLSCAPFGRGGVRTPGCGADGAVDRAHLRVGHLLQPQRHLQRVGEAWQAHLLAAGWRELEIGRHKGLAHCIANCLPSFA